MKKKLAVIGAGVMLIILCCLSGCADFAFHPIGTWHYVEHRYYLNDELFQQDTPESEPMMKNVSLVFQKSGTGYVDSGTKDKTHFTFDYTDKNVTLSIEPTANSKNSQPVSVDFVVSEDHQTMTRVVEQSVQTKSGSVVPYREELVYRR